MATTGLDSRLSWRSMAAEAQQTPRNGTRGYGPRRGKRMGGRGHGRREEPGGGHSAATASPKCGMPAMVSGCRHTPRPRRSRKQGRGHCMWQKFGELACHSVLGTTFLISSRLRFTNSCTATHLVHLGCLPPFLALPPVHHPQPPDAVLVAPQAALR